MFECLVDSSQALQLKARLLSLIDQEKDSIRFYYLGKNYHTKIEHYGIKSSYDPEGIWNGKYEVFIGLKTKYY